MNPHLSLSRDLMDRTLKYDDWITSSEWGQIQVVPCTARMQGRGQPSDGREHQTRAKDDLQIKRDLAVLLLRRLAKAAKILKGAAVRTASALETTKDTGETARLLRMIEVEGTRDLTTALRDLADDLGARSN